MVDGLPGDIVALALPLDIMKIEEAGLISPGWQVGVCPTKRRTKGPATYELTQELAVFPIPTTMGLPTSSPGCFRHQCNYYNRDKELLKMLYSTAAPDWEPFGF